MSIIQKIGTVFFFLALIFFALCLGMSNYQLNNSVIDKVISKQYHNATVKSKAQELQILNKVYTSKFTFVSDIKKLLKASKSQLELDAKIVNWKATAIPKGVNEWDFRMGSTTDYSLYLNKHSSTGSLPENTGLYFLLTFILGTLGALMNIIPRFGSLLGIKNDGIYLNPLTRGLHKPIRYFYLGITIVGILLYGYFTKSQNWALYSGILVLITIGLVSYFESKKNAKGSRTASPERSSAYFGIGLGTFLILFYVALYWFPEFIANWLLLLDPISLSLSGNQASQWFLYGFLYTVTMIVMGVRMISKYRHNQYQITRTISVIFFQTVFAFLLPEILISLNKPYVDFKNIWPLDYDFLFDWNINSLLSSGTFGIFILVWGIVLALVGIPLFTYLFGKRWYCSWVCGCGGLAETAGDPFRQLSDKSLKAWQYERFIIHGVLVSAIIMTFLVLYTFFTEQGQVFGLDSYLIRSWYGFFIGAGFSGVVGTGFYPLMGNRVWCRYGCPLAGYLGLVQRFQSRFRITSNGGQCISCGNCSTYCEMGIDVRQYAQKGQDILRSSCVGCGICAAVCPRGVLRLENGNDINERAVVERALHITENKITLLIK